MKCPDCEGQGGSKDYFGEWDDCMRCDGKGKLSAKANAAYDAELVALDAVLAPCECGVGPICECECGKHWSTVQ
jgi:hypothetical protein